MAGGEFDKGAKIRRIERKLENPEKALRMVGAMMVAESQQAFKDQRFGKATWEPRGPINILGIIADFHAGKRPPQRRFEPRPALRDTGRLAQSITFRIVGGDSVEVGSNLPYASVHQYGGETESKPINETVRKGLESWFKGAGSKYRKALGWLLAKKFKDQTIKSRIHPRPFVGITQQTVDDVREIVAVQVLEAE